MRLALVAHDQRMTDLQDWSEQCREQLASHELFATGGTGKLLEEAINLTIKTLLS